MTKPMTKPEKKPVGPPFKLKDGKRINVYLDKKSIDTASKIGDGNVSDGIRKALKDK